MPDVAARILEALGEAVRRRAGSLLEPVVRGLTGPAQDVDDMLTLTDRGWPAVADLDTTPDPRWLGAATGTPVPVGLSREDIRELIRDRAAWRRGTPRAMLGAARAVMPTGLITLVERDGSPWRATVRLYAAQATEADRARVHAAVSAHKPVGVVLTVELVTGASYDHLTLDAATYPAAAALWPTYASMTAHVPEEGTIP